jgi:HSP20 family protein
MFGIVRKATPNPSNGSQVFFREWDPFRAMENLLRLDNWNDYPLTRSEATYAPTFDVKETKDSYVFKADLPGLKEEDVDVSVTGNILTITGKREAEEKKEGENWHAVERSYGNFSRSFKLPETADTEKVEARMAHGVLTLTLPKRAESQTRKVTIAKS